MNNKIKEIIWTIEMGKQTIDKEDIELDNQIIRLYNSLPFGNKKKLVGQYLKLRFSGSIKDIYKLEIGEELKNTLTEQDYSQIDELAPYIKKLLENLKREIIKNEGYN